MEGLGFPSDWRVQRSTIQQIFPEFSGLLPGSDFRGSRGGCQVVDLRTTADRQFCGLSRAGRQGDEFQWLAPRASLRRG